MIQIDVASEDYGYGNGEDELQVENSLDGD